MSSFRSAVTIHQITSIVFQVEDNVKSNNCISSSSWFAHASMLHPCLCSVANYPFPFPFFVAFAYLMQTCERNSLHFSNCLSNVLFYKGAFEHKRGMINSVGCSDRWPPHIAKSISSTHTRACAHCSPTAIPVKFEKNYIETFLTRFANVLRSTTQPLASGMLNAWLRRSDMHRTKIGFGQTAAAMSA